MQKRILPAFILIVVLLSTGCAPQRKPPPEKKVLQQEPVITLYVSQTGERRRINLERYLYGVVAAEMEPTWPLAALQSQAILARTFTLQKIRYEEGVPARQADASTDTAEFQAYNEERINSRVRQAVDSTRGMVVTYRGRYIRAWFHANAGGKTATAAEGLDFRREATPYIQVVADPGQRVAKPEERTWRRSFPLDQVRGAAAVLSGSDPGAITSAAIIQRGPSGRAVKLRLGRSAVSGAGLRRALGPEVFRSNLLDSFRISGGTLEVSGRGYGHGVGMSQWGAYYFARQGRTAGQIINYYFRNVKLERVWR